MECSCTLKMMLAALAWSFYSKNEHGKINVDMLKTVRLVEALSGEKLVHIRSHDESEMENSQDSESSLRDQVETLLETVKELAAEKDAAIIELKAKNEAMERRLEALERKQN